MKTGTAIAIAGAAALLVGGAVAGAVAWAKGRKSPDQRPPADTTGQHAGASAPVPQATPVQAPASDAEKAAAWVNMALGALNTGLGIAKQTGLIT